MSRLSRRSLLAAGVAPLAAGPALAASARPLQAAAEDVRAMVAADETGLVALITDRERILATVTHGHADVARRTPATAETRFAIGSISKMMTAIALLQIADEGRFDPDAPIARYLPDFHPKSAFAPITGHTLATHTAGLPNYLADVASMRFLIQALNAQEPAYAPGAHFWYSNSGYQLLGYAAEQIDALPFPLILQRRLLDRLDMTASAPQIDARLRAAMARSYVRTPDGELIQAPWFDYLAADGAVVSTGPDMAAFARMLLARGQTPTGRLISTRAFERFSTPVLDGYGYGVDASADGRVLSHTGSIAGFRAYLEAHPTDGLAVVVLANGPLDGRERIAARLIEGAGGRAKAAGPSRRTPSRDPVLFAGRYVGVGGKTLTFAADDRGLALGDAPLSRLGRDTWGLYLTPQGPRTFRFFRDASGAVSDVCEGADGYIRAGSGRAPTEAPAAYRTLVGRYAAHGEEGPGVRILVRDGRLLMAYADSDAPPTPLREIAPGRFGFAEPDYAPERLTFDTAMGGKAQRLVLSGTPLYRIELP
jgi:CubicO group peptidase (beta-lactamase class C family)